MLTQFTERQTQPMDNAPMIAAAALLAALLGLWWWIRQREAGNTRRSSQDRLDTLTGWPPQPTRLLTTSQRLAYSTLTRALPGHMVLAQVPLARFLKVPARHSYGEWLRRMGNQCGDLVVCDMATQVIAVVEVQAPAGIATERARRRLNRMARVLKAAGIPLHVWTENALPSVDTARELLLPRQTPAPVATGPLSEEQRNAKAVLSSRIPTVTSPAPLDLPERDPSADEFIELREPPPSTWFDEFDSGPTPLQKADRPAPDKKR